MITVETTPTMRTGPPASLMLALLMKNPTAARMGINEKLAIFINIAAIDAGITQVDRHAARINPGTKKGRAKRKDASERSDFW